MHLCFSLFLLIFLFLCILYVLFLGLHVPLFFLHVQGAEDEEALHKAVKALKRNQRKKKVTDENAKPRARGRTTSRKKADIASDQEDDNMNDDSFAVKRAPRVKKVMALTQDMSDDDLDDILLS